MSPLFCANLWLKCACVFFSEKFVLLKLLFLLRPTFQLSVVLLLEGFNAKLNVQLLFSPPLDDLFFVRDPQRFHLHALLLLRLLLDSTELLFLPLEFQLCPHVDGQTIDRRETLVCLERVNWAHRTRRFRLLPYHCLRKKCLLLEKFLSLLDYRGRGPSLLLSRLYCFGTFISI